MERERQIIWGPWYLRNGNGGEFPGFSFLPHISYAMLEKLATWKYQRAQMKSPKKGWFSLVSQERSIL